MNRATMLALAKTFVAVESLKQGRQIANNALQLHFRAMHQLMTILAIPFESIHRTLWTRHLDDDADASLLQSLRRMPLMFGHKKNLALSDRNLKRWLARSLHDAKKNIPL